MRVPFAASQAVRARKAMRDPGIVVRHLHKPWYKLSDAVVYTILFVCAVLRHGRMRRVIVFPDSFDEIGYGYRYSLWRVLLSCGARYYHDVVAGADRAIAWQDDTQIDVAPSVLSSMRDATGGKAVLNARCTDIRKSTVGRIHQEVFGYSLEVDPQTWTGPMVKKSEANYRKDGVVVRGPLPREPGFVYQRLVDNELDEEKTVEYRVPVIGVTIPYTNEFWRPLTARFGMLGDGRRFTGRMHTDASKVFSPAEIEQIFAFTRRMGCDYTELDVLRSRSEGRIYVVDCNHTPGLISHPVLRYRCVHRQSRAFYDNFLRG